MLPPTRWHANALATARRSNETARHVLPSDTASDIAACAVCSLAILRRLVLVTGFTDAEWGFERRPAAFNLSLTPQKEVRIWCDTSAQDAREGGPVLGLLTTCGVLPRTCRQRFVGTGAVRCAAILSLANAKILLTTTLERPDAAVVGRSRARRPKLLEQSAAPGEAVFLRLELFPKHVPVQDG